MMEILVILFFFVAIAGGLLFFSWLYDNHPPADINQTLREMRAKKEAELEEYKTRPRQ